MDGPVQSTALASTSRLPHFVLRNNQPPLMGLHVTRVHDTEVWLAMRSLEQRGAMAVWRRYSTVFATRCWRSGAVLIRVGQQVYERVEGQRLAVEPAPHDWSLRWLIQ